MPQRAVNLVLALAGVAAVATVILFGVDPAVSARKGPKWKRRLLIAGIALMTLMGLGFLFRNVMKEQIARRIWTCYVTGRENLPDSEIAVWRLVARLELLKQQIAAERIQPEVVRATLAAIQQDIKHLRESSYDSGESQNSEQQRLQQLYREASRLSEAAEARLREQP